MKKYVSYSELKAWGRSRSDYIKQYVDGVKQEPNKAMLLGSIVHKAIEDRKFEWIPALREIDLFDKVDLVRKLLDKVERKRPLESEVAVRAEYEDLKIFSIFDGLDKRNRELDEFKTAERDYAWTQRRVDQDDQLSFYAWVYHLTNHSYFKEIRLHFLNTSKGNIKTFKTSRGPRDIEYIKNWVESIVGQIKRSGLWERRLSREEIEQKNLKLF